MNTLSICIADIPLRLELDCSDTARARIAAHYAAFITPNAAPAAPSAPAIRLSQAAGDPFFPVRTDGGAWEIHTRAEHDRITFESYFEKGWFDRAAGRGELTMRPQGDPENFLRVVYAWLVLDQSGLLIHAAGVISRGKGYVFFGHSGNGKTTISRLSLDRTVLSDDLVIIKKRPPSGKFWLYGVPFRGDFIEGPRVNADAELAGVFSLVQDTQHRLAYISIPEAIGRLAACVPFVMGQPAQSARVMETAAALAREVKLGALHFSKDAEFWGVIEDAK